MRASQRDHLWSFREYAKGCRCYYVNVAFMPAPKWLALIAFDLIVFDWLFLAQRPSREWFKSQIELLSFLRDCAAVKVALPQDEFASMDLLCDLIRELRVGYVFSVAPESEWRKLYRTVDLSRVRFLRALTGYLDEALVERVAELARQSPGRKVDIGYRTVSTAVWGRFNLLKRDLADRFEEIAPDYSLVTDIKVGAEHFFQGDEWLRFLLNCKYTLGAEGGSGLLDWDGSLSAKIGEYLQQYPDASFDELERSCLPPGADGEINVVAISPRHLEACLTRTCQILVEGDYNGILQPGVHYIELKRDFSNLAQVLEAVRRDDCRAPIIERAYQDVVASNRFTYRSYVEFIIRSALANRTDRPLNRDHVVREAVLYRLARWLDRLNWLIAGAVTKARNLRNSLKDRRSNTNLPS